MSTYHLNKNVLLRISEGVNSFYALTKKAKVGSNEGVLSTLERLQSGRLIQKGKMGSRRIQPYYLTEDGFDIVLRFVDEIMDFDSFVMNTREFFPLVFDYWESLRKHGLDVWVKKVLRGSVRRIDVQIWGELYLGDRLRYSHDAFVNDLYLRIYGPWISDSSWEEIKNNIPLEQIQQFLNKHPEIHQTRIQESDTLYQNLNVIRNNLESYRKDVLCYL